MFFNCPAVRAIFPGDDLCLGNRTAARMSWGEHGGTFVLRVTGLEVLEEAPVLGGEADIWLEADLPAAHLLEDFAGRYSLRLGVEPPAEELTETPVLVAGHIPGKNLFIFCEEPRITVRFPGPRTMEMRLTGVFRARRVASQETDIVIHLGAGSMVRLLAGLLAWAKGMKSR